MAEHHRKNDDDQARRGGQHRPGGEPTRMHEQEHWRGNDERDAPHSYGGEPGRGMRDEYRYSPRGGDDRGYDGQGGFTDRIYPDREGDRSYGFGASGGPDQRGGRSGDRGREDSWRQWGERSQERAWGHRSGSTGGGARPESFFGRGPKGYKRSDDRIREQVSDRLMDAHDVDASEISVEVKDGEVSLTGTVASRAQKRRAEELAEEVSGVSEVTNTLRLTKHAVVPTSTPS